MSIAADLKTFIDGAANLGATHETLVALLRGRGWPEEDVYRALADDYEVRNGIKVPSYKRSGSAKDAFLYLLSFSTLGTWAIGLGSIMFTLIERWIRDPLAVDGFYRGSSYQLANSLACVIVAYPIYLLVMRSINRELKIHPEKRESGIRKWLTYVALLIAACVVVGDLIAFLTYFLRGELTTRFVAKVATVLFIAGGIFWYYIGSMRTVNSLQGGTND